VTESSYFASPAADNSWVEVATNISYLPGFTFSRHLAAFLKNELPPELVSPLLHEMTHHWCFESPVGSALSLVRFRLLGGAMQEGDGSISEAAGDQLWMDFARYHVTIEALRPVIEGLALFMEYDARTEGSYSYSTPLLDTQLLCAGHVTGMAAHGKQGTSDGTAERLVPLMSAFLQYCRSVFAVERKADLLASPADPRDPHGHYLIGYLTMKALWTRMRLRSDLMNNTDAVASYLRSYFFHDWGLVSAILEDSPGEIALATRVGQYLQRRLYELANGDFDLAAAISEWDGAPIEKRPNVRIEIHPDGRMIVDDDLWGHVPGINLRDEEVSSGQDLLTREMAWFSYPREPNPMLEVFKRWSLQRFTQRSLMPIASEAGSFDYGGQGLGMFFDADGHARLAAAPFRETAPGKYPVVAELLYSPTRQQAVLLLIHDGEVIAGILPEGYEGLSKESEVAPFLGSREDIEMLRGWEAEHAKLVRGRETVYSIIHKHFEESSPNLVRDLYSAAVASITGQSEATVLSVLGETGILRLIGSPNLMRDLARLGILAGPGENIELLRSLFANLGLDLDATLGQLDEVERRHGFQTYVRAQDHVVLVV
jgi:hypothetical protein